MKRAAKKGEHNSGLIKMFWNEAFIDSLQMLASWYNKYQPLQRQQCAVSCGQCKGFCREAAAGAAAAARLCSDSAARNTRSICGAVPRAAARSAAAATAAYAKYSVLPYQCMYVICMHNS